MIKEVQFSSAGLNALQSVVWWFADPRRIAYHALSRVVRAICQPIIQIVLGIVAKRLLGLNRNCTAENYTQIMLLRRHVANMLLGQDTLHKVFAILGPHYEMTSVSLYRLEVLRLLIHCRLSIALWGQKSGNVSIGRGLVLFARILSFLRLEMMSCSVLVPRLLRMIV